MLDQTAPVPDAAAGGSHSRRRAVRSLVTEAEEFARVTGANELAPRTVSSRQMGSRRSRSSPALVTSMLTDEVKDNGAGPSQFRRDPDEIGYGGEADFTGNPPPLCWTLVGPSGRRRSKPMGVWAHRKITPGERIVAERAFYTCRGNAFETEDMQPYIRLMDDLCPGLAGWGFESGRPERTRRVYNSAFTPHSKRMEKKRQVSRLILSRALRDEVVLSDALPTEPTYRLFTTISKINHSCVPNAEYCMDTPGRLNPVFVISAKNVIAAGEEITICYSQLALLTADVQVRRKILAEHCGITYCRCPKCEYEYKRNVGPVDRAKSTLERTVEGVKKKLGEKLRVVKESRK